MKEIYGLLAEYNVHANGLLSGILEKAPPDLVTRETGSYFRSILGILNHILRSDLNWLKRLQASPHGFRSLATAQIDVDPARPAGPLYDDLTGLLRRRRQVDEVFIAFAAELSDEVLKREVRYANRNGEQEGFVIGDVLLHLFNHQTHHRGQISQILDSAGVENDYSNVMTVMRLRKSKR